MKCPDCSGTGYIPLFTSSKPCAACGGTGSTVVNCGVWNNALPTEHRIQFIEMTYVDAETARVDVHYVLPDYGEDYDGPPKCDFSKLGL